MVAMEKAGIPAVGIAAQSFARSWQACVDGWGQPTTAFVIIPHATTGQQPDFIRNMVDGQVDAIIQGLTTFPASRGPVTARKTGGATEVFTVEMDASPDGLNAVNLLPGRTGLERRASGHSAHARVGGEDAGRHWQESPGRADGDGAGLRCRHRGEGRD